MASDGENERVQEQIEPTTIGRTWADFAASFPVWLIGIALSFFVALMVYAVFGLTRPVELGFLGSFGPASTNTAGLPDGIVVASTVRCSELGSGWKLYEEAQGRFIIGVGATEDDRGELRQFSLLDTAGTFQHALTVPEMPSHNHDVGDHFSELHSADYFALGDRGFINRTADRTTSDTGGGVPHNNMPPYLTLHFCFR